MKAKGSQCTPLITTVTDLAFNPFNT